MKARISEWLADSILGLYCYHRRLGFGRIKAIRRSIICWL